MDRFRLTTSIVVLYTYLLMTIPIPTIVVSVVILIAYLIFRNMGDRIEALNVADNGRGFRRRAALKEASIYLAPYNDIWRSLKLSNKYCVLRLWSNGKTITAKDSINGRSFTVLESKVHSIDDLWDMFCHSFSHNTTFDRLVELCRTFNVVISTTEDVSSSQNSITLQQHKPVEMVSAQKEKERIDVNNASEVELTALPGVSIVLAKKLIKKREEINGFKSINDVFKFLNLKPHMENQLRLLICVNKIKSAKKIKRYDERSIDL